jgi:hypothetical protein
MIKKSTSSNQNQFPLTWENYRLIIIGVLFIIVGFILMSGGGSDDPTAFNPEIFSFRRITLAPIVSLFGFIFIIYAIMKKPKKDKTEE